MHIYYRHIILCILMGLGFSQSTIAQQVLAEVDSAHIMIGDHLKLYLKINKADGVENPHVDLSPLDTMQAFEVVKELDWEKLSKDENTFFRKELTITSFDSGYFYLPSFKIDYSKNGRIVKRNTQQIQLAVITPQLDSLQIRPIKNIVTEPITIADFYPIFYGVGGLLLLCLGGYFLYRNIKKKSSEEVYVAPKPAHEIALNKLKNLEEKQLWQKGEIKAYQSELTYIVREYLEKRYEIQALESTTDEITKDLDEQPISDEHKKQLAEMFQMADMVKFAKATPPLDVQSTLLNEAQKFVLNTKQEIIVEPNNPDQA